MTIIIVICGIVDDFYNVYGCLPLVYCFSCVDLEQVVSLNDNVLIVGF